MLLDVGKTKLPDSVLKKKDLLSPDEYEVVKAHVMHSVDLIRGAEGLPNGVEEIVLVPTSGRMAVVIRMACAASTSRSMARWLRLSTAFRRSPLRGPIGAGIPSNALSLMHKLRGKLFHEALVEQFIQCIGIYPWALRWSSIRAKSRSSLRKIWCAACSRG